MTMVDKCNCGKEQRYTHSINDKWVMSCNKHVVCPTYDELAKENAELKVTNSNLRMVLAGTTPNQIKAEGIREGAEVVAEALQKENFPTPQALAMGRFYTGLLDYASELEQDNTRSSM